MCRQHVIVGRYDGDAWLAHFDQNRFVELRKGGKSVRLVSAGQRFAHRAFGNCRVNALQVMLARPATALAYGVCDAVNGFVELAQWVAIPEFRMWRNVAKLV